MPAADSSKIQPSLRSVPRRALAALAAIALASVNSASPADTTPAPAPTTEIDPTKRGGGTPIKPKDSGGINALSPSLQLNISALPEEFDVPAPTGLPDGTYVHSIAGTVVRVGPEQFVLVPDARATVGIDGGAPIPAPPMVLLPSQRLAQLGANFQQKSDRVGATIAGQVYTYRGFSHLLLTSFVVKPTSESATAKPKPAATPPGAANGAKGAAMPSTTRPPGQQPQPAPQPPPDPLDAQVGKLLKDLENASAGSRVLPGPKGDSAQPESREELQARVAALQPERTLLVQKRGRLVRLASAGGRFAFAIDNDADSPAPPPMLLAPCRILEDIEQASAQQGEDLSFVVTGRVLAFRERNYLLPVFFQAIRPGDVRSGQ
jgi:hypothetical protein